MIYRKEDNIFIRLNKFSITMLRRDIFDTKFRLIIGNTMNLSKEEQKAKLIELKSELLKAKTNLKIELLRDKECKKQKKEYDKCIKKSTDNLTMKKKREIRNEFRKLV